MKSLLFAPLSRTRNSTKFLLTFVRNMLPLSWWERQKKNLCEKNFFFNAKEKVSRKFKGEKVSRLHNLLRTLYHQSSEHEKLQRKLFSLKWFPSNRVLLLTTRRFTWNRAGKSCWHEGRKSFPYKPCRNISSITFFHATHVRLFTLMTACLNAIKICSEIIFKTFLLLIAMKNDTVMFLISNVCYATWEKAVKSITLWLKIETSKAFATIKLPHTRCCPALSIALIAIFNYFFHLTRVWLWKCRLKNENFIGIVTSAQHGIITFRSR